MNTQTLRANIAHLIELSQLGDEDLAALLGVNRSNVNRWRRQRSTCSQADALGNLFDVPLQTLAFGTRDDVTDAYKAWSLARAKAGRTRPSQQEGCADAA